ncbi:ArsR/SmtB family transcription factor [Jeotgalibacillus terrae]|uniref:ArsR/SmtB family transcription factor n=1 Tax=Jeotgalibacillus terrae TaxID=587735 RepID=A0ABW5ZLA9_9BACL|nr:metalloregulator ArsR/SmtB family transcription factor [Jeotgalibacillus terrae]MBM7578040.1 ArsR family transcriptional regulator [Jeotgalibacillus terrae]
MEPISIFKALSNETRLNILKWLKEPEKYFPVQQAHLPKEVNIKGGVCVGDIQAKVNLSQSTVSQYLSMMQQAGLLESERYEQWTYYRRNEKNIAELIQFFEEQL